MTDERLKKIAALEVAATPGPWVSQWNEREWPGAGQMPNDMGEGMFVSTAEPATPDNWMERMVVGVIYYDGPHPGCREENAAFIAAARADVPDLLAHVAALTARAEAAERALIAVAPELDKIANMSDLLRSDAQEMEHLRAELATARERLAAIESHVAHELIMEWTVALSKAP